MSFGSYKIAVACFEFHFQNRKRIALFVGFGSLKGVETQMSVETFGLGILLVHVYIAYVIMFDGCADKLFTYSFPETVGRNE